MAIEVNGKTIETTENGYLVDYNDWNEDVAKLIAEQEGIELTEQHWDVIHYLRDEHINNGGNEPNERTILKAMAKKWGTKPTSKDMYQLFPLMPSKQGRKIAGLSQSTRKGGY
ncbi:TusE/DsrC/DsvC family sulfur relay protein [Thiohalobacter sp. IOR34]|uniref:TusE/DsrC/DsvC family sulfur relay protein n=1 Tax=Thiohalobacter sp. IOR34 TaxID=3057176 RepID=UPI0025B0D963|nr:TusE/DsrC/DsvC family sulfur relay protein [Thiohalobacter sp. IOR34]WJW74338.1 TusE/DsrC/DsvC family sulfur relay protein [Thiohalobacter sp. IOR34]